VQLGLWGYYLDWFESAKQEVEAAMEDSEMMEDVDVPEAYRFPNPGEAVAKAKEMGVGEDRDLAGDEMIHTRGDGEDTVFMPAPSHEALLDRLREMDELAAADVSIPMPSESVQLLYPEQSVAASAARAMGLGDEGDADGDITHPHDFEGETWYMPGADHGTFVDAVSGMDAGMAGTAPVAKLNEYKAVGPIEFRGTREGDLDESAIPSEGYESHYFNAGDTKSASSFPLVDGEGYLRRGNLDAAWGLRGQGDLGMPRESAERLMLNLGLVFGAPDSESNPLPQEAYDGRDDVGTPFAEEAAALAAVVDAVAGPAKPDDPETGEVPGSGRGTTAALTTMTDDPAHDAALGSYLANAMAGKMEEMAYREEMSYAEMMREMASHCGMSESHLRSIQRGDTGCPSLDAIEAMSDVLDADMGMLLAAAERDGCEYSEAGHYGGDAGSGGMDDMDDTEERMADSTTKELKATLADKTERIEELENEIEDLRAERDAVASEYAEALAGTDTVLDAETMAEKFTVAELAEMYEDAADAALAPEDPEPAVRSGSDGSTPESEALSSGDHERVAELEGELEQWEQRDSRLAAVRTEEIEAELAELRGDN
jgi:transcriptional regulator with XRE-family HTH domain